MLTDAKNVGMLQHQNILQRCIWVGLEVHKCGNNNNRIKLHVFMGYSIFHDLQVSPQGNNIVPLQWGCRGPILQMLCILQCDLRGEITRRCISRVQVCKTISDQLFWKIYAIHRKVFMKLLVKF